MASGLRILVQEWHCEARPHDMLHPSGSLQESERMSAGEAQCIINSKSDFDSRTAELRFSQTKD